MAGKCRKCVGLFRQNLLVILTLVGVGIGFVIGFAIQQASASGIMWIGMAGELYIRMLKMMIVPLVICSVISGTAKMDPRSNGKVSGISLAYIMITNLLPVILATVLSLIIRPGDGVKAGIDLSKFETDIMETEDIFADLLRNIVPDNLIASCFQQTQTKYKFEDKTIVVNNGTHNVTTTVKELSKKYLGAAGSTNILGLIIVSAIFGVAAAAMQEHGEAFLSFFRSATDIIIKILRVLIWATPVGVASLIAKVIISTPDVEETFRKLGLYFVTVMVGLVIWGFMIVPAIFFAARRTNPFRFIATIMPSIMIVFATGSTVIALPESFHSLESKNHVDSRISRFVAPLAATIGRAGSALYISSSCIFIIQMLGRDANAADIISIILLTWISALAIPSVTGASLVTVLILLTALNIPGEAAAMLFALEFFLDRSRSVVNLNTQLTGAIVTDTFFGDLSSLSPEVLEPAEQNHLMKETANKDTTNI
ncbi:excitatory amino acid transporter 2-like [Mercenaria mercenaria]|uniref:excitatory amino acid transporter 2-like n=1 Tax=Mercenaria mercenaria TaxID=6596 RepID=UPI00234E68E3|nr:excitatory amino acid transporter 2-like [Mercenaria mercenaria]